MASYGFTQIYAENAKATTLQSNATSGAATITLADATGWPSPSNAGSVRQRALAAISFGDTTGLMEIVRFSGLSGAQLTGCERGLFGTTAQAHTAGVQVRHIGSGHDLAEFFAHQYTGDHYSEAKQTLNPAGATPSVDCLVGTNWDLTLSANATVSFANVNSTAGTLTSLLVVVRNGGTAYTVTWPASVKWAGGSTPSLSGVNKADLFSFISFDGGTTWAGMVNQNFASLG